jgi:hypothetical protein
MIVVYIPPHPSSLYYIAIMKEGVGYISPTHLLFNIGSADIINELDQSLNLITFLRDLMP